MIILIIWAGSKCNHSVFIRESEGDLTTEREVEDVTTETRG